MGYDLTNLGNVTNYLSQQRQTGSYIPTNGSLGQPSQGWDGWNNYNVATKYSPATSGAYTPMSSPLGPSNSSPYGVAGMQNHYNSGGGRAPPPRPTYNTAPPVPQNPLSASQRAFSPKTPGQWIMGHDGQWKQTASFNNPPPLSQTLQKVQDYGSQYGNNAYYFQNGVNDFASKLANWQQIGQLLGKTPEEAAMLTTGKGIDYWHQMQQMYDQGQHPTTDTTYTG